jgi:hypothetical protein
MQKFLVLNLAVHTVIWVTQESRKAKKVKNVIKPNTSVTLEKEAMKNFPVTKR